MSTTEAELQCQQGLCPDCSKIQHIIEPRQRDLGGFSVRRVLPYAKHRMVGPWIFFDHMGPAVFPAGQGINVRPHPHINLATVTYLFEGEILHRDSLGYEQAIVPGDINLMVAGSGIVHSERERPEVTAVEHRLHGLQLWMALPESQQEIDPAFYHYDGAKLPTVMVDDVPVRVMIGKAYGVESPVVTFATTLYLEADLKAGQSLTLPETEQAAVYVAAGQLDAQGTALDTYQMAVLTDSTQLTITAQKDSRIALIGGENLGPRHMYWNFASTSLERIEQAKFDWQHGRFDKVVGDEEEWIPLP